MILFSLTRCFGPSRNPWQAGCAVQGMWQRLLPPALDKTRAQRWSQTPPGPSKHTQNYTEHPKRFFILWGATGSLSLSLVSSLYKHPRISSERRSPGGTEHEPISCSHCSTHGLGRFCGQSPLECRSRDKVVLSAPWKFGLPKGTPQSPPTFPGTATLQDRLLTWWKTGFRPLAFRPGNKFHPHFNFEV